MEIKPRESSFGDRLKIAMGMRKIGVNGLDSRLQRERYTGNVLRRRNTPEAANIKLIAEALDVPYMWLAFGTGPAPEGLPAPQAKLPRRQPAATHRAAA